jgi:hypothetical protein
MSVGRGGCARRSVAGEVAFVVRGVGKICDLRYLTRLTVNGFRRSPNALAAVATLRATDDDVQAISEAIRTWPTTIGPGITATR